MLLKGVIDCPDLPLNVSRSALQNDGFVKKISEYITKKVADKLIGMCKKDKENYEKYWDDISPFIKFGCLKDTKFCDKMNDYILFKNLDDKYLTLPELLVKEEEKKDENKDEAEVLDADGNPIKKESTDAADENTEEKDETVGRKGGHMKTTRQAKILELIQKKDVETQEELSAYLEKEGFQVTQATVSRDIRELKLTKISTDNGRQKYAVITDADSNMMEKYARVLREGFLSVDAAENIVVIKTVSGMAGAVAAAVDAMRMQEIVGSLAGDDTILCVIRTSDDAVHIMKKLRKIVEQ